MAASVLDLSEAHYERAVRSLLDLHVRKHDDDILICFKATSAFAPNAFEGLVVALILGDGYEVPGMLVGIPPGKVARGLWYEYAFKPLRADDRNHFRFSRLSRWLKWSNVREARLETKDGKRTMKNPFFKA